MYVTGSPLLDSCVVYGWRRGRLCRSPKPVAQTRKKNQTTTKPRRLLMTQLSWQTEGKGK